MENSQYTDTSILLVFNAERIMGTRQTKSNIGFGLGSFDPKVEHQRCLKLIRGAYMVVILCFVSELHILFFCQSSWFIWRYSGYPSHQLLGINSWAPMVLTFIKISLTYATQNSLYSKMFPIGKLKLDCKTGESITS